MILKGLGLIVTGGSTGIGKAVAHSCLLVGADVLICARNSDSLKTAKGELAGAGDQCVRGAVDRQAVAANQRNASESTRAGNRLQSETPSHRPRPDDP